VSPIALFIPMLALGFLLGAAFFGSLWWTVRRGLTAPHPVMWFGLGTLARMTLLLIAFYYVTREGWPSVVACLSGVLIARVAVERITRHIG
jgi:F1F0 ATPase subunit 2